jgi:hypothetical protein
MKIIDNYKYKRKKFKNFDYLYLSNDSECSYASLALFKSSKCVKATKIIILKIQILRNSLTYFLSYLPLTNI